ncbi:MAG: nitrate reductase subunit alpha, partial [Ottowia sp.]|nr:nitrate reductase subunit alpha [Ottowia sp.]
ERTLPDGRTVVVPGRYLRASDFNGKLGQKNNPEWKTVAIDQADKIVLPNGSIGFRWGAGERDDLGKWNLEDKEARDNGPVKLKLSLMEGEGSEYEVGDVAFPYFGGIDTPNFDANKQASATDDVIVRKVPVRRIRLGKAGDERYALVATVFDLTVANYGVPRGLPGENAATNYDQDLPYTPAWQ